MGELLAYGWQFMTINRMKKVEQDERCKNYFL